jgi:YidC/Oxa1 family membrane protein insertase
VLNGISKNPPKGKGFLTDKLAAQAADASVFGANISEKFIGADSLTVQIVTAALIVLMSASTFITQKQLMTKNMPAGSMDGNPFMQQQKILLYVFPLIFAVSGINFPVGVLLYWLTTNIWSMGQQFYVIRRMPAPGSAAEEALARRRAAKNKPDDPAAGGGTGSPGPERPDPGGSLGPNGAAPKGKSPNGEAGAAASVPTSRQRQQPRRQPKRKR